MIIDSSKILNQAFELQTYENFISEIKFYYYFEAHGKITAN